MSSNLFSSQLLQEAAAIARKIVAREGTRVRWATVTSTDPLLIRYDGEPEPSIVSPQTIAAVAMGRRVAVAKYKGQALVLGTGGGMSGGVLIEDKSLTGDAYVSRAGNRIDIPSRFRGQFSRMDLILQAGISGATNIRTMCVQFNGDDSTNYRSFGNYVGTSVGEYSNNGTRFPRSLYTAGQLGTGRLNIVARTAGWVYWDGTGYYNSGASVGGTYATGGRWNGPNDVLRYLNVGSSLTSDTWVAGSRVQLWGFF